MRKVLNLTKKAFVAIAVLGAAVAAQSATITVNSPAKGSPESPTLVKGSTTISFSLSGMVNSARVGATVRRLDNNSVVNVIPEVEVSPDSQKNASGSLTLTFTKGQHPEVAYRVEVRARDINNATTYNNDQDLFVKPDLTKPKILQNNPIAGSFVKGIVPIRVRIQEENLKDWRVQVNNQDIPNNTGTTVDANGVFTVNWDTRGEQFDGPKTINIRVRDEADNEETLNVNVTIDRLPPVVSFRQPTNNALITFGTTISVVVDIRDFSNNSVSVSGVDVVIQDMQGRFIARVARDRFQPISADTVRWSGRIRWRPGFLPNQFRLVATAVDKAGNRATPQTVTVRLGG
jgi:hypothetical protein